VSKPKEPKPAKLVVSCLARTRDAVQAAADELAAKWGPVESEFGPLPFHFTSYYEGELGPEVRRWLWAFRNPAHREDLACVKAFSNRIEASYSQNGRRTFNLDPGFLSLDNFVLATGKGRPHRVYLRDGIFADLTLVFIGGTFIPTPWTYPDYAAAEMIDIMNRLRRLHKIYLRSLERNERDQEHDRFRPGRNP
jgi:hypothetical protein